MKKLIFFFVSVFFISFCSAQSFPEDYVGKYKGTLTIDSPRGKQEIPMEFHLNKTDSANKFDYILIYNNQPRNYTLIIKDKEKGICEVDENNGIILPSKFSGSTLYSFFEVQSNFLSSRLDFQGDTLFFEILFSNTKKKIVTRPSKEALPVSGYPISTIQKAVLKKVN